MQQKEYKEETERKEYELKKENETTQKARLDIENDLRKI